ncbi:MAG: RNA polymerase subunit sigma-54 [Rhodospirillales bacterium CG15_BIG_FIL_POST_REV_8_21_14_020_66_15]|nr:MAG: RNA polymerase subunit sigma-54 [Rhodospirillales bacterium CG15_BIG_FIL_POST_REV_8_21_14_020_66_15]
MVLASLCFACMHAVIKKVAQTGIHPFETAFFRLLFGMLPIIPFFVKDGLKPLKTKRLGLLTLRGTLNSVAMMCYFTALAIAPLAQVTALGFSAPIFASVLAVLFLGEVIRLRRWTAILLGFAGTLVILRPGVVGIELGPVLVVISSLIWGGCLIIIKKLSETESSATITVYMSLVMMPILLVPSLFVWQWPDLEQWGLLIALGCLGGGAQLSMAQSLKLADTHVVGPIDFVRLVWVTALGYVIFDEMPDLFVWIGGAMILGSTAYIAYREHRLGRTRGIVAGPPGVRTTVSPKAAKTEE